MAPKPTVVRLACPHCGGKDTWANYVCTKCSPAHAWSTPAYANPGEATPFPQPCPGCGLATLPSSMTCYSCEFVVYYSGSPTTLTATKAAQFKKL